MGTDTIVLHSKSGADSKLRLEVEVGLANTEFEVVVRPKPSVERIRSVRGKLRHLRGKGTEAFLRDRHEDSAHGA
jgi:hypothetical protein